MIKRVVDRVKRLMHDPMEVMSLIEVVLIIERILQVHVPRNLILGHSDFGIS